MGKLAFTKMQGLGNDYIYVDATQSPFAYDPVAVSIALSPRHFAVGADGLVLILPPENGGDFKMRIWNADGSEAMMCGNATRCIAKYLYDRGLTKNTTIQLETNSGIKILALTLSADKTTVINVAVDMGVPILVPSKIPALVTGDTWVDQDIDFGERMERVTLVSMGNPHAVIFTDEELSTIDLPHIGPMIENCALFPEKINVEFAQILDRHTIEMRVWERGSGETLACGTGACAVAVAAIQNNLCDRSRSIVVKLLGGDLTIDWPDDDSSVIKTGPAAFSFDGSVDDSMWLYPSC